MSNTSGVVPLGHAILVETYEVKEVSTGGIILPQTVREKDALAEQRAVIVEIGPEAWKDEPPRASVGDRILFTKYAGYVLEGPADGKTYRVINDRDVFLRIVQEKDHE